MAVSQLDTPTSNGASKTHTYSVSAGTDRHLIVCYHVEAGGLSDPSATAVTYGGQDMIKHDHVHLNAAVDIEISVWGLNDAGIAAASGTTISVTSGGTSAVAVHAASYAGVDQTTPLAQAVSKETTGSATPNPLTSYPLTVTAGNALIAYSGCGNGTTATWANVTERTDQTGGGSASSMADTLSSGVIDPECTWASQNRAVAMALELAAAGGGGGTSPKGPLGHPLHGPLSGPVGVL